MSGAAPVVPLRPLRESAPVRVVTAASLFDGHDAAINIMRRLLQAQGAEVIHLGHDRGVDEIVDAVVQEDADAVAVSSYQGGHLEFFGYLVKRLSECGAGHVRVYGGGGGTITADEAAVLESQGVARIFRPEDGRRLGLEGMIREILDLSERPDIISLAGGWPSPDILPVDGMHEASERVLLDAPHEALQDVESEGYGPLREWVAAHLAAQKISVQASQVLITTDPQQGLDLIGKALIDPGSRVAVESPTSMSALRAFAPYEPEYVTLTCGEQGPLPHTLETVGCARFVYVRPNFQQPGGRCISPGCRFAFMAWALAP